MGIPILKTKCGRLPAKLPSNSRGVPWCCPRTAYLCAKNFPNTRQAKDEQKEKAPHKDQRQTRANGNYKPIQLTYSTSTMLSKTNKLVISIDTFLYIIRLKQHTTTNFKIYLSYPITRTYEPVDLILQPKSHNSSFLFLTKRI